MRNMWNIYKSAYTTNSEFDFEKNMLNNIFSEYMEYMYNTYPPIFCNKMKECNDKGLIFDGLKIFNNLLKNKI